MTSWHGSYCWGCWLPSRRNESVQVSCFMYSYNTHCQRRGGHWSVSDRALFSPYRALCGMYCRVDQLCELEHGASLHTPQSSPRTGYERTIIVDICNISLWERETPNIHWLFSTKPFKLNLNYTFCGVARGEPKGVMPPTHSGKIRSVRNWGTKTGCLIYKVTKYSWYTVACVRFPFQL